MKDSFAGIALLVAAASMAACDSSHQASGDMLLARDVVVMTHDSAVDLRSSGDRGDLGDLAANDAAPDAPTSPLKNDPLSASSGSNSEHEPQVAVAPNGHVVVAFNAFTPTGITIGYRISNDFGATWGPTTLLPIPEGDDTMSNTTVAADPQGNLYLAWAAEKHTVLSRTNIRVFAAKAGPTDLAFGDPVQINDPSIPVTIIDMPVIAVMPTGEVHVLYAQVTGGGMVTTVVDASTTDFSQWTRTEAVGPGTSQSFRNGVRICQPNGPGRIFLVHYDSDVAYFGPENGLALRYSDDNGATWSTPIAVQTEDEEIDLVFSRAICVTRGDDVWILYPVSPEAPLLNTSDSVPLATRLRLAHSGDRGLTIDSRVDVADSAAAPLIVNPSLAIEEDGALNVAYYAGRIHNDPEATFRRSRSTDGKTFTPSVVVQSGLTLETSRSSIQWLGDYSGSAYFGGQLYLAYTDNAANTAHIGFVRTPPKAAGEPPLDGGVAPVDGGLHLTRPSCYVPAPFTPNQWAPPTAFGQGACSPAQLTAYLTCLQSASGDCSAFRSDMANTACLGCIETDVGAAAHGPIVTQLVSGQLKVLEVNYGGCEAHFDGQMDQNGCGSLLNAYTQCTVHACGQCSDFNNPAFYGPTYECAYTSWQPDGVCTNARLPQSCMVGGQCSSFAMVLPMWCGGP